MTVSEPPSENSKQRVQRPKFIYSRGTEPDPRFTLANERTFLAWIRTGVAFIAGGIALNAFTVDMAVDTRKTISIIALALGSIISLWAWISWARVERSMRERQPLKHSPALVLLSGAVFAIAVIAAIAFI
jgi:putative membrane protein